MLISSVFPPTLVVFLIVLCCNANKLNPYPCNIHGHATYPSISKCSGTLIVQVHHRDVHSNNPLSYCTPRNCNPHQCTPAKCEGRITHNFVISFKERHCSPHPVISHLIKLLANHNPQMCGGGSSGVRENMIGLSEPSEPRQ